MNKNGRNCIAFMSDLLRPDCQIVIPKFQATEHCEPDGLATSDCGSEFLSRHHVNTLTDALTGDFCIGDFDQNPDRKIIPLIEAFGNIFIKHLLPCRRHTDAGVVFVEGFVLLGRVVAVATAQAD